MEFERRERARALEEELAERLPAELGSVLGMEQAERQLLEPQERILADATNLPLHYCSVLGALSPKLGFFVAPRTLLFGYSLPLMLYLGKKKGNALALPKNRSEKYYPQAKDPDCH
jgi:hypothetical protein